MLEDKIDIGKACSVQLVEEMNPLKFEWVNSDLF